MGDRRNYFFHWFIAYFMVGRLQANITMTGQTWPSYHLVVSTCPFSGWFYSQMLYCHYLHKNDAKSASLW